MSELYSIPLKSLIPSPRNVRKTGGQSIDDLAASIHAHGLLQNLTVIDTKKGYEVVAGGRRLAALKQLAKQKKLPASFEVPCLLIKEKAATEASIAENTVREAMHPADQFEAFRQLIEGGKSIPDTAAAFGVTETVVRQRLKLANLSPRLLIEYRTGNATLEQMQALALTDDHAAQEAAWGDSAGWHRQPAQLRRAITHTEVPVTDKRAAFVGLEAYQAAGGVVRRDLFDDMGMGYLSDEALLDRLVVEKLETTAEGLRADGWSWVEVRPELNWSERNEYASAGKPKRRPFTEAEQAEYDKLSARFDELDELFDDVDPADAEEHASLQAKLREMNTSRDEWPAKIKAVAGAVVYLDDDGIEILLGVLKPGQRLGEPDGDGDGTPVVEQPKPKKDPAALSQTQEERLAGEVTAILRANVSGRVALAALAASLLREDTNTSGSPVCIGKQHTYMPPAMQEAMVEHPAYKAFEAMRDELIHKVEAAGNDAFGWLLKQPMQLSVDIIAFYSASALVTKNHGADWAAQAGINIADHWTVTEEWLAQQSKAYILAALDEVGISNIAYMQKLKVAQLAAEAVTPLKNAGWLPKPLRVETGA